MSNSDIIEKTRKFVTELFAEHYKDDLAYHKLSHTESVADYAWEIADGSALPDEEKEIAVIAAWMHDLGYLFSYEEHEAESIVIAEKFLREIAYPEEKIRKVSGCIRATKMPQSPVDLTEQVVCDADLSSLGRKSFAERNSLLRTELQNMADDTRNEFEWYIDNIGFLSNHKYHTSYARKKFDEKKKKNIQKLQNNVETGGKEAGEAAGRKALFNKPPDRGIETMFRNNLRGHLELSSMADSKANIMLSVNAIIISISLSTLFPRFDTNPEIIIPTAILLLGCLLTILFATIATIPNVTQGTFTKEDIKNRAANLLFFGNFHKMDFEDFECGMHEMMIDRDFLYGSMIKDFYNLGKVLNRKYYYLRICYATFMIGLVAAIISFTIAFAR